jgi:hypothetical protein
VTKSLEGGLKQLRDDVVKRFELPNRVIDRSLIKDYFWIDQICESPASINFKKKTLANELKGINQADIEERNSQITLMRRIYRSARTVTVWLGIEADNSATAVDVIEKIGRRVKRGPGEKEVAYPEVSLEQKQKNWKAVRAFYQRDWWQRVWIRQELALGRAPNMLCGKSLLSFSTAVDAARYITSVAGVLDGSNTSSVEDSESTCRSATTPTSSIRLAARSPMETHLLF